MDYLGVPIADDPNEGSVAGGYFLPMDLDPNNMTRSDARLAYYEPYSYRPNFNVQVDKRVTRLLFDNSTCDDNTNGLRVIGVEVSPFSGYSSDAVTWALIIVPSIVMYGAEANFFCSTH